MSVRIHQLAKKIGLRKKDLVTLLQERGFAVKSASSTIDNISEEAILNEFGIPSNSQKNVRPIHSAPISFTDSPNAVVNEASTKTSKSKDATEPQKPKGISLPNNLIVGLNPFSDITARDWLASLLWKDEFPCSEFRFMLMGDGPFESVEFACFLRRYEVDCDLPRLQLNGEHEPEYWKSTSSIRPLVVVAGCENIKTHEIASLLSYQLCQEGETEGIPSEFKYWIKQLKTEDDQFVFIRSQSLKDIVFIPQEVLLACLFSGCSAAADLPPPWSDFIKTHPMLEVVEALRIEFNKPDSFAWPSTNVTDGDGSIADEEWPQIGLLKHMGYTAGANGESKKMRRQILSSVFGLATIPRLQSSQYMHEWGTISSANRLQKMANVIATLTRNSKRRSDPQWEAITDWEDDLAWLKRSYYDGKFNRQFPWPKTSK